ncbi:hypothetical protein [Paludisphaera mucosa]|uniref:Uncharacterized protein n=1 Tax=Paludisphaera mucosa TaxID=3030827 RepID=A0ABT6FHU6_9BACT|nr:hypothetical protein [Paludisphaera mucosa]MDG3007140.1 hypothetical protein [Paludisphaera mucosa]
MRLPGVRFSMRRMMAWVILAAVMLALVRYSVVLRGSEGLTELAFWTFFAIAMAPYNRQGRRAMFLAAFSGFGMMYLSFTNYGYLTPPFRLPTSLLLEAIHDRLPTGLPFTAIDFHRAGHVFFAVAAGTLAGLLLLTQVPENLPVPEAIPFRARARATFPTVFGLWDRLWSARG